MAPKKSIISAKPITCANCNRAVWSTDVDAAGNCNDCVSAPHTPTEAEQADLGRPEDKE